MGPYLDLTPAPPMAYAKKPICRCILVVYLFPVGFGDRRTSAQGRRRGFGGNTPCEFKHWAIIAADPTYLMVVRLNADSYVNLVGEKNDRWPSQIT